MEYVSRHAEDLLKENIKQFPIVVLTGSRQCGKSTLLKHFGADKWHYITFDKVSIVENARSDPDLFIQNLHDFTILDEAQKVPDIFGPLKARIDEHPNERFTLSGSANFQLMGAISETFAGRVGVMELYPFNVSEVERSPQPVFLKNLLAKKFVPPKKSKHGRIEDYLFFGGYPKIFEYKTAESKQNWFENYKTTYIERDIRNLAQVANLDEFQRLYKMCAFQTGNILNYSSLSKDLGISVPSCKKYISLLETSYQVFTLRPYYINIGKRLVKSPKIYFLDTGLANYLLGNLTYDDLQFRGHLGNIFETWVITEIFKSLSTLIPKPQYHFWRTENDAEIDLLIEWGGNILPIEIKSASRVAERDIKGFESFVPSSREKGSSILDPIVIYRGAEVLPFRNNVKAIPVEYVWS